MGFGSLWYTDSMKLVIAIIFVLLVGLLVVEPVNAKMLPQSKGAGAVTSKSTSIGVYPRLRADRRALLVSFSNLSNAKQVTYMLTYKTSGQDEAAMGGLNLNGSNTQSAEILFGTCSKNVCRYHQGIRDARLEVSYTKASGKKYLKKFRIKV